MNIRVEKAVADARTIQSLVSTIDELLMRMKPDKDETGLLDRIQDLFSVLTEKAERVCKDLYELELDSSLVDVFQAVKEARSKKAE